MRVVMLTEPAGAEQPLFIEFVNTLHWDEGKPVELLGDQAGLAAWLAEHALPGVATDAWLPPLWSLREHVRPIIRAIVAGERPADTDVEALTCALGEPGGRLVLVDRADGRPEVGFQADGDGAAVAMLRIALSLANFLSNGERHRLKLCANPGCGF